VFPVVSGARIEGARVTALVIENQIDADVPSDDRRPVAAQKGHEPEGQPANGTS
jgi:hypothetical protein